MMAIEVVAGLVLLGASAGVLWIVRAWDVAREPQVPPPFEVEDDVPDRRAA